jgi:hypothetical protein
VNEQEADFEEWKYGGVEFVYPGDGADNTSGRDNPEFMGSALDLLELSPDLVSHAAADEFPRR